MDLAWEVVLLGWSMGGADGRVLAKGDCIALL